MEPYALDAAIDLVKEEVVRVAPKAKLEFTVRKFEDHAEVWVHVLSMTDYEAVAKRCRELSESRPETVHPIWVFAKTWTGPWPGGESEQRIKERRKAYQEAHRSH